jgi:hypothetical protein
MSLQGDLFSSDAIGNYVYDLHHCHLSNAVLLKVFIPVKLTLHSGAN